MTTVNVSITLKKQIVPADPPAATWLKFSLKQGAAVVSTSMIELPAVSTSFPNVADGEYTIETQRISLAGTPIGDASVSQPFTVVNMTEIDVPDVVSVTL